LATCTPKPTQIIVFCNPDIIKSGVLHLHFCSIKWLACRAISASAKFLAIMSITNVVLVLTVVTSPKT